MNTMLLPYFTTFLVVTDVPIIFMLDVIKNCVFAIWTIYTELSVS
jgi:hypothetical protein